MGWFQGGQWGGSKTQGWMRTVAAVVALRPQDVFATTLYTGTGSTQQVDIGFGPDLSWLKSRSSTGSHFLLDSLRGTKSLSTNTTAAEAEYSFGVNSTGFQTNAPSGGTNVAWSFKRAPKFFDVVTYTGDGTSGRQIGHGLGIKPGMIVVKVRSASGSNWNVYHQTLGATKGIFLNLTDGAGTNSSLWANTEPSATTFTVGNDAGVNLSGQTYVAYLFAHDPDTTSGIIQCGSYTTNGSGVGSANLGWQPQYVLLNPISGGNWFIIDAVRVNKYLRPNESSAEASAAIVNFTSTGFNDLGSIVANGTVFYCAIRAPT